MHVVTHKWFSKNSQNNNVAYMSAGGEKKLLLSDHLSEIRHPQFSNALSPIDLSQQLTKIDCFEVRNSRGYESISLHHCIFESLDAILYTSQYWVNI